MGWWESNCIPRGSPKDSTETQIKALTWLAFPQQEGGAAPQPPSHPTHICFVKINLLIMSNNICLHYRPVQLQLTTNSNSNILNNL